MKKTDVQKVLDALNINRVMAKDADGNYTREVTPKLITDAIAICEADLARVDEPLIGPPETMFHDAGAIAQCGYCKRYTLDRKALDVIQPVCACGYQDGWSGSFVQPGPDSIWHGPAPVATPQEAVAPGWKLVPVALTCDMEYVAQQYHQIPPLGLNRLWVDLLNATPERKP